MADADTVYVELQRQTSILRTIAESQAEAVTLLRQIVMAGGMSGDAPAQLMPAPVLKTISIGTTNTEEQDRAKGKAVEAARAAKNAA